MGLAAPSQLNFDSLGGPTMDDEARRLRKQWKADQKASARAVFPLPDAQLVALFRDVELEFNRVGCDHTRRLTEKWLTDQNIPAEPVLQWLDDHGGYCDCEVLANAADHFESNRIPAGVTRKPG